MQSIIREVAMLRNARPMMIDDKNSNRYCLILQEKDRTKTAYCFSTPIYNAQTRKLVDMKFRKEGEVIAYSGSNADITISNEIRMENAEGACRLSLKKAARYISEREVYSGIDILAPTTNGIAYKAYAKSASKLQFDLEVSSTLMGVRTNEKYFSLMREEFRPFLTVSCIGVVNPAGEVIAPAKITSQKMSETKYRLTLAPCDLQGEYIMFEMNLYEPKIFQDTTVESLNPTVNNAFGGTAFIGNTPAFGEQWLYSRTDSAKLPELLDKYVNQAVLHIPKYNRQNMALSAYQVAARFCSFASNWENKISATNLIRDSRCAKKYQSIDVTELLTHPKIRYLLRTEGFILKTKEKSGAFSAIATGDSCYAPQILEVNYK